MNKIEKIRKQFLYLLAKYFMVRVVKKRPTNTTTPKNAKSFYDFKIKSSKGETIDFSAFKGKKVILFVEKGNVPAISLYNKFEYRVYRASPTGFVMEKNL